MQDRFRFVKDLGIRRVGKSTKMFSLFECPFCHQQTETQKAVGLKQVCCKKCYKYYRTGKKFGNIVDKVLISGY